MDQQVTDRRGSGVARRAFGFTALVHFLSAACFLALVAADLEGCDRGDGAVLALVLAIALDVVLAVAVLVVMSVRRPGERRQVLLGGAAGLILALAGVVAAAVYIGGLGSGCPV
ncbi:hypothetical protein ACTOB_004158 [Actinoplanes oblitus]|uniref:Uncharacterized protein n=1 Tax=Actinoplanes oblitus TaxID=3040509 RepID=A0ABY8WRG5_9ACTN|nr:hypothetical protein [Actinoplanes oblitus]WIN00450.1 hypothetical protein ACTOB_004158 [Actinoplanes oblitus]